VEAWSDAVWEAARAGDSDEVETLLAAAPADDDAREMLRRRRDSLNDRDHTERHDACDRLLNELAQTTTDSHAYTRLLTALAELRSIDDTLPSARVDPLIDTALDQWVAVAAQAEEAGDIEQAIDAWIVVQSLAAAPRHATIQLKSMDRMVRLADRRPGAGRGDPLPPETVNECLRIVLKEHVDRLDVNALVDSGFDALIQAARAIPDSDARAHTIATIDAIRADTLDASPTTEVSIHTLRVMSSTTRRAIERTSERLAAARDAGTIADEMADPIRVFLGGMLEKTDLRTRAFLGGDAETLRRLLGASFVGIGVRFEPHPDGIALHPLPGGPARRAGVLTGDILVAIDGVEVDSMTSDELVTHASGRRGTGVELRVLRGDDHECETIVVVRDRIEIESVHGWRQIGVDGRGRPVWDWIVDPEAAIAFVSIREFDGDTDRLFREAMREADRALGPDRLVQGLILDLRENPGGDRTSTERLLDLFINDGDVFRAAGELPIKSSTRATIASTRLAGLPVVVLVSGHSASASELVAGTLQGTADALVVGDRTFGKGSVQGVHPVRHGYMLVTESWFLVPTGSNGAWRPIDRARANEWGVTPTIHVPTPASELQDALAERGEWVSQLGRDVEGRPVASVSLEETTDRGLLTAVLLLRARLLPTIIGSDAAQ
jgi:C-terminal peptidase prc